MSKEDSFAWQKSPPFETSKVLREIGSDLAIPSTDPFHPIPNVNKNLLYLKREILLAVVILRAVAYHPVGNVDSQHFAGVAKLPKLSLFTILMVMVMVKMPMVKTWVMNIRANLCHCYRCFPSAATKVKQTIS